MRSRLAVLLAVLAFACADPGGGGGGGGPGQPGAFRPGQEHALDPRFTLSEAPGSQTAPRLVPGDPGFLVVWTDTNPAASRVAATRVGLDGVPGSPAGELVAQGTGLAALARGSGQSLVAYELGGTLYVRRLAPGGVPLDASPTAIGPSSTGIAPAAAHASGTYLVVWARGGGEVAAVRIAAQTGTSLDGSGFTVARLPVLPSGLLAAAAQDIFVAGWAGATTTCGSCRLSRIPITGPALSSQLQIPAPSGEPVALASDGQSLFLVALRTPGTGALLSLLLTSSGSFIGLPLPLGTGAEITEASLAHGGDRYLLTWVAPGRRLAGMVLDRSGSPASVPLLLASESVCTRYPQVAVNGSTALVVWRDAPVLGAGSTCSASETALWSLRFGLDLGRRDASPRLLSQAANTQTQPDIAAGGDGAALVAWRDRTRGPGGDVFAIHVTAAGAPADGSVSEITSSGAAGAPAVMRVGSGYAVAWRSSDGRSARSARLAAAGSGTPEPGGIQVVSASGPPIQGLAAHGTAGSGLLVFARGSASEMLVFGPDGMPVSFTPRLLDTTSGPVERSAVAYSEGSFMALVSAPPSFMGRMRLAPDGSTLDGRFLQVAPGTLGSLSPAPGGWLVAWRRDDGVLVASAIGTDGNLRQGGQDLTSQAGDTNQVALAFADPEGFAIWDQEAGGYRTLYAARVSAQGRVRDRNGERLFTDTIDRRRPRVVGLGGSAALVVYERSEPSLGATRVYALRLQVN